MKNRWWIVILLLGGMLLASAPEPAHASLSGSWSVEKKLYFAGWDNEIVSGPHRANITDNSGRLVISVSTNDSGRYDFAGDQNGNRVTGTLTSRSGMGTFENSFEGEISAAGNRLVLRSDYIWTYNGKQDRWNKNYKIKETWVFTR